MKVIFYKAKGNFFDKLIRWWTSSSFDGDWKKSYSHCEILFSSGYMFSASQYENKTRFKYFNEKSTSWDSITVLTDTEDEAIIQDFCRSINGKKYDYLGILGFVFGNRDHPNKWFCSEVCTRALKEIGLCYSLKTSRTSPNALYTKLKEL